MRWLLVALVLLLGSPAHSQDMLLTGAGKPPVSYVGPLDIVPGAIALYSLRAGSAAIASAGTQSIVDLRRASDNATCTAKIATNGSVDLTVGTPCNGNTQTVTAWIGASSALVSKWYDQSGNGLDISQGTAANQPQLFLSGGPTVSCPYIKIASSSQGLSTARTPSSSTISLVLLANILSGNTSSSRLFADGGSGGSNNAIFTGTSANLWRLVGGASGAFTASASDATWHYGIGLINAGGTATLTVDGVDTAGTAGSNATAGSILLGFTSPVIALSEAGIYEGINLSSGQRTGLNANAHAACGGW